MVRDGRLTSLIDRLSAQTGLAVAVFGMIGLKVQIFNWRAGKRALRTAGPTGFSGGQQEHLSDSAAGWLLLSTVAQTRRDGMIRRLNAEAAPERKFSALDMTSRVQQCRDLGHANGIAGFGSIADITAVLLPDQPENQPLAIGLVYEPSGQIASSALLQSLTDAVGRAIDDQAAVPAKVQPLFNAA